MTNPLRWSAPLCRNDLPAALITTARLTSLAALAALAATSVVLEVAR
ncbi:hypothetical protein SK854_04075 [Lentzea sp. BCCO 10_0061]|uniref:Uncharacterized protein n=1 Tax=Lentzea sokolovensis TaxID=3095429 RepID=A0ABU4UPB5_9PSEU|nr:hypothetical protein [Lentzea sp. BCCO 10_0061]MDX8141276.1 hypothetical protein [Lentzea sp. BCCO 10_0061]